MPTDSDSAVAPSDDTLRFEQAFQDDLIAKRLPDWLHELADASLAALCAALKTSLDCRQRLRARWRRVQGIEAFVGAALQDAFDKRFATKVDVATLWFRHGYPVPLRGQYFTTRVPVSGTDYAQTPLVEAAMRNFVASESVDTGQPRGNGLLKGDGGVLISPVRPSLPGYAASWMLARAISAIWMRSLTRPANKACAPCWRGCCTPRWWSTRARQMSTES